MPIYGVEGSTGPLLTLGDGIEDFDIGWFFSGGKGWGWNLSVDAFVGFNEGSVFNLMGDSYNINAAVGPVSLTGYLYNDGDLHFGDGGFTFGIGPSFPGLGGSFTLSHTNAVSYRTLIRSTTDFLCSATGNC